MNRNLRLSAPAMLTLGGGCMVGPKYQRPPALVRRAFKEPRPEGWRAAQPSDGIRGKWREIYRAAQYKAGTASSLQVITTQAIASQNERTALDLLTRRLTSSVLPALPSAAGPMAAAR